MLNLGAFAFAAPWMLLALAALPVIWRLLRVTPPAPRRVWFPAIRLLFDIAQREETPARTPWWLLLLRLVVAALIILALARPVLDPTRDLPGDGPLALVVDNGWAAAARWSSRQTALADLIEQADRRGRSVILAPTAPAPNGDPFAPPSLMTAAEARDAAQSLVPQPWPVDRAGALAALTGFGLEDGAHVVWLSDGVVAGADDGAFAAGLRALGGLTVIADQAADAPRLLTLPRSERDGFRVAALRPDRIGRDLLTVRALSGDGRVLGRQPLVIEPGADAGEAVMTLPAELRNEATRIEIVGARSAGAVALIDERWRRRPVGLISDLVADGERPLLGELYYLERALAPFAEVRIGPLDDLLARDVAVLALVDGRPLARAESDALSAWMAGGGLLARFAGPRLAQGGDRLTPVPLRIGDRATGGAMSWAEPAGLAEFDAASPFHGLAIADDVVINRQVLAQPSLDLAERTWARLTDGTPLVTAQRIGDGWLVLFHVTSNADWSNLPLSGLFVDMMRRLVDLSAGVVGDAAASQVALAPAELLDGFGVAGEPGPAAAAIAADAASADLVAGPATPPGFYGRDGARRAVNLGALIGPPEALPAPPSGVATRGYGGAAETPLQPWLFAFALALFLADMILALGLRGLLAPRRAGAAAIALAALLSAVGGRPADAQAVDDAAMLAAALDLRLAYVLTGDHDLDAISRAGLQGLSYVLTQRTAVEPAEPVGVDLERDELAFYPVLYWPLDASATSLSAAARSRVADYMSHGGLILFDTRDAAPGAGGLAGAASDGELALRAVAEGLDIPPLTPIPPDHVLTRAFYLLDAFPGRFAGAELWVEQRGGASNDGVSTVVIGGNDWAGAWAIDLYGRGLLPVLPGGERQREMAFRFGVNLVMYALTGNYKADQVHIPAILERLGQ